MLGRLRSRRRRSPLSGGRACEFEAMRSLRRICIVIIAALVLHAIGAASVVVPSSNCYAFDNSSHLVDFSSLIGQPFVYEEKDTDLVVRFCKDVETRSQTGYVDFGRFDRLSYFDAGSGHVNFVQGFYNGDLTYCEGSYDKRGRTAHVDIICGSCLNGQCKGHLGCICNVTYESTCRVLVELAVPCEKLGPRVFQGFTVGFHPRSWEIVHNGMTQLGFEKSTRAFSFSTEQTHVTLYMIAVASLSKLVQKPVIQVLPEKGLEVKLSGSGTTGSPPTALSPTMLSLDWKCLEASDTPYEVNVTIPIESYDPIQFVLTKLCEHRQDQAEDYRRGWAIFGVISCIFLVSSTLVCCGGFLYKTRVECLHGIDALPGMTILTACLEILSGTRNGYSRAGSLNGDFASEASWERPSTSAQGKWGAQSKWGTRDRNYGST